MTTASESVEYLLDQLNDPAITARAMFGGHGIYRDGRMFALVYNDTIYMKIPEEEAATTDRPPFRPRPNQTFPSFREISADEIEDTGVLAALAQKAQQAARSSRSR
ncbi:MAG: TfoX/Sxy family protein [Actinomycetota bacterium]|nr:TfoX/Sxy family protein [Actinomycetota bacterium]